MTPNGWRVAPGPWVAVAATGLLYARGWRHLNAQAPERFPPWRAACFVAGLLGVLVALVSPLDRLADLLLTAHMIQHLLLQVVAPPLLLLGAPAIPLLRGLPPRLRRDALGPFLASAKLRDLLDRVTHPLVGLAAASAAMWAWHLPSLYQLAVRSPPWHAFEHACLFWSGLWFWWPVVARWQPWPPRAGTPAWLIPPVLLIADVQNTALAALLTFSGRILYPVYGEVPRLGGISPLDDQVLAGALMWVGTSLFFLTPAVLLTRELLSGPLRRATAALPRRTTTPHGRRATNQARRSAVRPRSGAGLDLLGLPGLGTALRSGWFREGTRAALFAIALAIVADGFLGPRMAPMNLAGVVPWTHARGIAIVGLLVVGNLFCSSCPFTLARDLARRWIVPRWTWPRVLRSKLVAAAVLLAFLVATEVFALWDAPVLTAWLVLAYLVAPLIVDSLFQGASFCKWVCPVGQVGFLTSLVSPFEVRVREPETCANCRTHDCLRGRPGARGCEMELFLPSKVGNLDCTFCLDCVRACPHDNIGVLTGAGLRRIPEARARPWAAPGNSDLDGTVLAVVFVAGGWMAAAVMVAPVVSVERTWLAGTSAIPAGVAPALLLLMGGLVIPLGLLTAAAHLGSRLARAAGSSRELMARLALALAPLGASLWAAHALFHLVTGWSALYPVVQRVRMDLVGWLDPTGVAASVPPDWTLQGTALSAIDLTRLQFLLLDLGLLASLWCGWHVAQRRAPSAARALALVLPWMALVAVLYGAGAWTFLQPMAMRGTMVHG